MKPICRPPLLVAAVLGALAELVMVPPAAVAGPRPAPIRRIGTIEVPGQPLASFDIGFVNRDGVYALADRSNAGLDFFDSATGRFLGRATGFRGYSAAGGPDESGPNGVVAVGRTEFWAGDGDSTVKAVDLRTKQVIASVATGGKKRADEIAY